MTSFLNRQIRNIHWAINHLISRDVIAGRPISKRADLVELGSAYGAWVIPTSLIASDSVCYLAGCGEDISFDLALIQRFGCDVYAFDPTPRAVQFVQRETASNSKYHFFDSGLWDESGSLRFYTPSNPEHVSHSALNLQKTEEYFEARVESVQHVMHRLGHDRIDLLKLDIEGSEYRVIDAILAAEIPVRVLCVEFDEYANPIDSGYRQRIASRIDRLAESGYAIVWADRKCNYTFVYANT